MKKNIVSILAILAICAFLFAACGNPSIDSIKTKFQDEGYSTRTMSQSDIDDIAGVIEGFTASKGQQANYDGSYVSIRVLKFDKKTLAEEYKNRIDEYKNLISLKDSVYVCTIQHWTARSSSDQFPGKTEYHIDSPESLAALKIFDSFF